MPKKPNSQEVVKMALDVAKAQNDSPTNQSDAEVRQAISQVWTAVKSRLGSSADADELDKLIQQLSKKP